jgi:hypothetical protein
MSVCSAKVSFGAAVNRVDSVLAWSLCIEALVVLELYLLIDVDKKTNDNTLFWCDNEGIFGLYVQQDLGVTDACLSIRR